MNRGITCGGIVAFIVLLALGAMLWHDLQAGRVVDGMRTVDGLSLVVSSVKIEHDQSGNGGAITGTIKNTTAQPISNAMVQFRLTDANGSYAGHATDRTDSIAGGDEWHFSCPIDNATLVKDFQFDDMSGDSQ